MTKIIFKFPHYIYSILAGMVIMPIFSRIIKYASKEKYNDLIIFILMIFGFMFPVLLSTVGIINIKELYSKGLIKIFPKNMNYHFKESNILHNFLIPTWKRMLLFFISTVMSEIIIKYFKIYL